MPSFVLLLFFALAIPARCGSKRAGAVVSLSQVRGEKLQQEAGSKMSKSTSCRCLYHCVNLWYLSYLMVLRRPLQNALLLSVFALCVRADGREEPVETAGAPMQPVETAGTGLEEKAFETVRRSLDVHARMTKAQEGKVEANSFFAAGDWRSSVISYLTCIWFLQRGNQPCPSVIVSQADSLDGVCAALGDGDGEEEEERGAEERQALRVTLHLNLAAAALKLKEWEIARIACEFVFSALGFTAPSKAFYRLAKAHEGEGSLPEAIALLEHLLTKEPGNMEAALLCDALRKRQKTADAKLKTPKVEDLRQRVEAAGAAARPAMDLEKMSAADFGRLSQEEQEKMVDAINRGIDAEDDSVAAQGEFDTAELQRALGESR